MARPYIMPSNLHNHLSDKRPRVAEEETESQEHTGAPLRGQGSNRGFARLEHRQFPSRKPLSLSDFAPDYSRAVLPTLPTSWSDVSPSLPHSLILSWVFPVGKKSHIRSRDDIFNIGLAQ